VVAAWLPGATAGFARRGSGRDHARRDRRPAHDQPARPRDRRAHRLAAQGQLGDDGVQLHHGVLTEHAARRAAPADRDDHPRL
jgi:hypothetical protein